MYFKGICLAGLFANKNVDVLSNDAKNKKNNAGDIIIIAVIFDKT